MITVVVPRILKAIAWAALKVFCITMIVGLQVFSLHTAFINPDSSFLIRVTALGWFLVILFFEFLILHDEGLLVWKWSNEGGAR